MKNFVMIVIMALFINQSTGFNFAHAQSEGSPRRIGDWEFLNYISNGVPGFPMPVCSIKLQPAPEGWWIEFAGKGKIDTPVIGHTNMHVPVNIDTILTLMLDKQPVRMQISWVSRTVGGFALTPIDREKYMSIFPKARTLSLKVPGVEVVNFHMSGTSEAFNALSECNMN